jgi:hypothetical protein
MILIFLSGSQSGCATFSAGQPVECQHPQHGVAVHDASGGIDGDQAVGVAVEREADVGTASHDFPRERRRRRGSAARVDVDAVRVVEENLDLRSRRLEDPARGDPT